MVMVMFEGGLGHGWLVAVWLVTMVIWLQGWHTRCWFWCWCFGWWWWWCWCWCFGSGAGARLAPKVLGQKRERRWALRGVMEDL